MGKKYSFPRKALIREQAAPKDPKEGVSGAKAPEKFCLGARNPNISLLGARTEIVGSLKHESREQSCHDTRLIGIQLDFLPQVFMHRHKGQNSISINHIN